MATAAAAMCVVRGSLRAAFAVFRRGRFHAMAVRSAKFRRETISNATGFVDIYLAKKKNVNARTKPICRKSILRPRSMRYSRHLSCSYLRTGRLELNSAPAVTGETT